MEAKAKLPPLCPEETAKAKEDLSIVTTLLLSPGAGTHSAKTFYAHFLMRMNTLFTNRVPTAGVSITDKLNLYINPTFFNALTFQQKMELIEHEIEHIVYMHPIRAKDYIGAGYNSNTHKLFNIATDAGINENKPHLAKDLGVTFARLNEELKKLGSKDVVGPENPSEITYDILKRNQIEEKGAGLETSDDHSTWDESTENREVAEAVIRDTANKAQAATGVGNMPEGMLREIANMNKATVNWRRQLHQAATSAQRYLFERTRNRRNRRYGIIQPGRKKKPKLKIITIGDSSGSVCDEAYAQYFAEIGEIQKATDADIFVIDADCEVQDMYEYDPKKVVKRTGYGGTAYQPAISKAKELGADLIIYFGDMDAADVPVDPGIPFIWAVVGQQNPPGNFGKVVRVEVEGRR